MSIRHKFSKATPRAVGVPSPAVRRFLVNRVIAAGGDPADVPEFPFRMFRIAEICEMTGLCQATIYRLMDSGELPRPVHLHPTRSDARAPAQCSAA